MIDYYNRMVSVSVCFFASLYIYDIALADSCLDCQNDTELPRNKRVIYGTPLRDFNSYDVVGYYVHISLASGWSWFWYHSKNFLTFSLLEASLHPLAGRQMCGGSLITQDIVQTACHCLTKGWTRPPNWKPAYRFPIMNNGWEDMMILHHGYTKVVDFKDGVWSRKFVVHLECKKNNRTGTVTHDYGVILTTRLLPKVPWTRNNFAPVYTERDLAIQYYRTIKREAVCLFAGFGKWYFRDKKEGEYGEESPELMHGWRSFRSYWECYINMLQVTHYLYGLAKVNIVGERYFRDCSWSCHTFFGRQRGLVAPGDSGGPVTCSDEYFGLNSFTIGTLWHTTNKSIQAVAALGFNMFENAIEYRDAMIKRLYEYAESHNDYPPEVRNPATVNPFDPNSYYYVSSTRRWNAALYVHAVSSDVHGTFFTSVPVLLLAVLSHTIIFYDQH